MFIELLLNQLDASTHSTMYQILYFHANRILYEETCINKIKKCDAWQVYVELCRAIILSYSSINIFVANIFHLLWHVIEGSIWTKIYYKQYCYNVNIKCKGAEGSELSFVLFCYKTCQIVINNTVLQRNDKLNFFVIVCIFSST